MVGSITGDLCTASQPLCAPARCNSQPNKPLVSSESVSQSALTLDAIDCLMPYAFQPRDDRRAPSTAQLCHAEGHFMTIRDPEKSFEQLWKTFHRRYPFFALRNVDWIMQYETYRPKVTRKTSDDELFNIFSQMLAPLNDGHVELMAKVGADPRGNDTSIRFRQEFTNREIKQLFKTTNKTLAANGFGQPTETEAWMLHYCRSQTFGYIRILELEGVKKRRLTTALDTIARDFHALQGIIIDVRDNPGGDDGTAITIINRFCDRKRVAFHRKTKIGPGDDDFTALATWHIEPQGDPQFTGPIVLLTCDFVFSGAEVFTLGLT